MLLSLYSMGIESADNATSRRLSLIVLPHDMIYLSICGLESLD